MKPNKRAIRMWVKALRSGKYKQTRKQLRHGDAFCCLGVACDVFSKTKAGKEYGWVMCGDGLMPSFDKATMSLPTAVSKWLGLDEPDFMGHSCDPLVNDRCLSSWNDDNGASFKKIATLIEKEWL